MVSKEHHRQEGTQNTEEIKNKVKVWVCASPETIPQQQTRRTENAFEKKKRLPASACLFSFESGVMALSRKIVGTALIQPRQTPTTHDTNKRVNKLTILLVTIVSISEECLAIANLIS